MIDWDDAFDNSGYVSGSENLPVKWLKEAEFFKKNILKEGSYVLDLPYGTKSRNALDLFLPSRDPEKLVIFIHGGYWHKLGKEYWSHLAKQVFDKNIGFAIPSYSLAPKVSISEIYEEVRQCIKFLSNELTSKFVLVGHSAGGHLVTRLNSKHDKLPKKITDRVLKTISVSGIHDLRPLLKTKLNNILQLDLVEAENESPVLHEPIRGSNLRFLVGAEERPEFLRQAGLIHEKWKSLEICSEIYFEENTNHFSVIETILKKDSYILKEIVGA